MEKKFSLKRLIAALRDFVKKRGKIMRLIVGLTKARRSLITKQERMMRLLIVVLIVMFLCISGLALIQLPLGHLSSGMNGVVTDPKQSASNYPPSEPISNVGSLKTIGIGAYWDENVTNKVDTIDWGILEPGAQSSVTIYFHNEGNFAVTLSKSASNWNPEVASNYLTLSWNYNGQILEAGKNLQVTLTLSVSANVIGITDFGFDIIVLGTG